MSNLVSPRVLLAAFARMRTHMRSKILAMKSKGMTRAWAQRDFSLYVFTFLSTYQMVLQSPSYFTARLFRVFNFFNKPLSFQLIHSFLALRRRLCVTMQFSTFRSNTFHFLSLNFESGIYGGLTRSSYR